MSKHRVVTMEDILSGKVSLSAEVESICKVHGEPYKYYCKDEQKAICQDCVILKKCPTEHDRITIDEAAQSKSEELDGLVKRSVKTLKKYQEAVKATELVGKELEIHTQIAKDVLSKVEQDYSNLVKKTVKRFGDEIEKIKAEKIKELNEKKANLGSTIEEITKAKEDATRVIKSKFKIEVVSSHTTLSAQLQNLLKNQPVSADKAIGYVKFEAAPLTMPTIGEVVKDEAQVQRWQLIKQFRTEDFERLHGLVINEVGDIGLTSAENGVQVFTRSGERKCILINGPKQVLSIAMTLDNKYVVDGSKEILMFDDYGNKVSNILLYDMQDELSFANSVTVDFCGKMIAGLVSNTISIHNADGSLISKFATQSEPLRLAATSNGEIVSSFYDAELEQGTSVQLMDYSGGNLRVIQPPAEVKVWRPGFVCCGQGEIFVSNTGSGKPNGVYRYTAEGDYLGCVTTEVSNPSGIALSKDGMELFVADSGDDHVKIFQRP